MLCAICMMTTLFSSGIIYAADEGGSGTHSGRYMSSQTIDRMAYAPQRNTSAYKALILDRSTTLTIAKTVSGEGIQEETYAFTIEAETTDQPAVR